MFDWNRCSVSVRRIETGYDWKWRQEKRSAAHGGLLAAKGNPMAILAIWLLVKDADSCKVC